MSSDLDLQAAVGRLEHRAQPVARRLVGAEQAEVAAAVGLAGRARVDVAQHLAEGLRVLVRVRAGDPHLAGESFAWAARPGHAATCRRSRTASPTSACPLRVRALRPPGPDGRSRRRASRGRRSATRSPASPGAPGSRVRRTAAPGGPGRCPGPARRRPTSGPVQPFGVRSTMAGQRVPTLTGPVPERASDWISRMRSWAPATSAYSSWSTVAGSVPSTMTGSQPWPDR